MPEPRNLNYFILPDAEIVQFNNKANIQRCIGVVNAVRDWKMGKCKVIVCCPFRITSKEVVFM